MKETNKHKVHKKEGKSEEALKAFKRGKEFGRHADALEITLRKDRKRALSMWDVAEAATKETSKSQKPPLKDDLAAELRDLGWSDDEDKNPENCELGGIFRLYYLKSLEGVTHIRLAMFHLKLLNVPFRDTWEIFGKRLQPFRKTAPPLLFK